MKKSITTANRPGRGADLTVEPITDFAAIERIHDLLLIKPRDACIFTLGINSAYRMNELLALTVGQVSHLEIGTDFKIKQSKTKTHRVITMNEAAIPAIQNWLRYHPNPEPDAPLFPSHTTGRALTVATVNTMIKEWCRAVGLQGKFGCHTPRKTWGHWAYKLEIDIEAGPRLLMIMEAFGHTNPRVTMRYIGHQFTSVRNLYLKVVL